MRKTENLLKRIPDMKNRIKKYRESNNVIEAPRKIINVEYELKRVFENLKLIDIEHRQVIAYRYFDNKTYREIGVLINCSSSSAQRKADKAVLKLGREMFGMEKEFWDKFK